MKWVPEDVYHARRRQMAEDQIREAHDAAVWRRQFASASKAEKDRMLTELARKEIRWRAPTPKVRDPEDRFPPWFPPPPPELLLPAAVADHTPIPPHRWDDYGPTTWAVDPGKRGPLASPFESPTPGGIDLNVTARLLGDLSGISGAVYDEETDRLVLVGQEDVFLPSIRLDDLAVALKCLSSGQHPFFSLDPADPKRPDGPWLTCVYHGDIEGTAFGAAMFEADWWLKAYSFGRDQDGFKLLSRVPDYKSMFDLSFEHPDAKEGSQWIRYWITCDSAVLRKHGNALRFDDVRMKVNTENMWRARSGLQAATGQRDPLAERFAQHFTEHYEEFAQETPALSRVKQLACAVALADWMLTSDIPIDPALVERWAAPTVPTPTRVSALSASESRETRTPIPGGRRIETFVVYLSGGVDLSVAEPQLRHVPNAPEAAEVEAAVKQAMAGPETPTMAVPLGERELTGVVLPLTRGGRGAWESGEVVDADGSIYTLDSEMRVSKVRRPDGITADVGYASDGSVADVRYSSPSGWRAAASSSAEGARMRVSSPAQDAFDYEWDASGEFERLTVNGQTLVTREVSPDGRSETFTYPAYLEKLGRDPAGRLTSRTVVPAEGSAGTRGSVSFQYDESGRMTRVVSERGESIAFSYQGGALTRISSGGKEATCGYDANGRLVEITSGEAAVRYQRSGEQTSEVKWQLGSTSGGISLEEGQVTRVTDGLGNTTRYEYGADGRVRTVVDPGGHSADFQYSAEVGITGVNLPGGRSLEFKYSPLEGMESGATGTIQRLESIIIHPVEGEPFGRRPGPTSGTAVASAGTQEKPGPLFRLTRGLHRPTWRG
jgi:YD repeat-containing protein